MTAIKLGRFGMSKRDWKSARAKCEAEDNLCRVCYPPRQADDPAHIVPRSQCKPGKEFGEHPDNIVPLCRDHHTAYDREDFDLLPYLSVEEQARAVLLSKGIITALERTTNREWVPVENDVARAA